ncbi:MAG: phosphotransferase [Pseudomonadota bacterium]
MTATHAAVVEVLTRTYGSDRDYNVAPCAESGNNRVYRVELDDLVLAAKCYVADPGDGRDRMGAEWGFLSALAECQVTDVPGVRAQDAARRIALYDFVDGAVTVDTTGPREGDVEAAARFIRRLANPHLRETASGLSTASEACFSTNQHFSLVRARVERLEQATAATADASVKALVRELGVVLAKLQDTVSDPLAELGFALDSELRAEERCLSPSDFGFHNAMRTADGTLVFIDFEYAGWDDPAKLWADIFYQPRLPVDRKFESLFLEAVLAHIAPERVDMHAKRARMLRPLFGIKWCCIILNPLLPGWGERRFDGAELNRLRDERVRRADAALTYLKTIDVPASAAGASTLIPEN